jgi:hypothetical protein
MAQPRAADELATSRKAGRLTPVGSIELAPWQWPMNCPVAFLSDACRQFPYPLQQRAWLLTFLERVASLASSRFGQGGEVFLQYKTVTGLLGTFSGPLQNLCR